MSLNFVPWTRYETLYEARLVEIGNVLRRTQSDCVKLHDEKAGDNSWALSCRVYARRCFVIEQSAQTCDWLTILPDKEQKFAFAIGSIPFRFYHGEAGDAPDKYRMSTNAELHQYQNAFDFGIAPVKDKILRLAADTDPATLLVTGVTLVEMDAVGNLTGVYSIPEKASGVNIEPMRRDGVVMPKAKAKPLNRAIQNESEQETKRHDAPGVR